MQARSPILNGTIYKVEAIHYMDAPSVLTFGGSSIGTQDETRDRSHGNDDSQEALTAGSVLHLKLAFHGFVSG
jgi:hypothetical protein